MDQFLYSVNIIGSHHTINPYITEICRGMPGKKIKEACYSLKAIRTILDIVMHLINTTHTHCHSSIHCNQFINILLQEKTIGYDLHRTIPLTKKQ